MRLFLPRNGKTTYDTCPATGHKRSDNSREGKPLGCSSAICYTMELFNANRMSKL